MIERIKKRIKEKSKTENEESSFLIEEKRTYLQKFLLSITICFSMVFTFLLFGPFEIMSGNITFFTFTILDMIVPMTFIAIVFVIGFSFLVSLCSGKLFNYVMTILFSISLCGYIQGNFLNTEVAALTGESILWKDKTLEMFINFFIWLTILIIVFTVLYYSYKKWNYFIKFVSFALIIMQSVAGLSLVLSENFTLDSEIGKEELYKYFSQSEIVTFSEEDNVVIFVLDMLDYRYVDEILSTKPEIFEGMDGFTCYTNAISRYGYTYASMCYMLTQEEGLYEAMWYDEYYENAWGETGLLHDLKWENVNTNIYTTVDSIGGDYIEDDLVSNLVSEESTINQVTMIKNILKLSAYRYMPTALKPFFWTYTDEVNHGVVQIDKIDEKIQGIPYEINETIYDEKLGEMEVTEEKQFKLYHFLGAHYPFILNEEGYSVEGGTGLMQQIEGSFQILYRSFEKMKELGIYEDMEIIVLADHREVGTDIVTELKEPAMIGLFHKPKGVANQPMNFSSAPVSHENVVPTILNGLGMEYEEYGVPINMVEDKPFPRTYIHLASGKNKEGVEVLDVFRYETIGDASKMENWNLLEMKSILDLIK